MLPTKNVRGKSVEDVDGNDNPCASCHTVKTMTNLVTIHGALDHSGLAEKGKAVDSASREL